jgi:hypothetical protein
VFEAFVLICLLGQPTTGANCEELVDTRGPYATHDECLARIYEIQQELPAYKPYMEARAYRCDEFTPQKDHPA